jgi:hypothetical protein
MADLVLNPIQLYTSNIDIQTEHKGFYIYIKNVTGQQVHVGPTNIRKLNLVT